MRFTRWVVSLTFVAVACSTLLACSSNEDKTASTSSSESQVIIGLITKTDTNPFFVTMKKGAQKEAKARNAKLLTAAGKFDGDTATQITAIENMVSAGAKGILITPGNNAVVPAIKKARKAGVVVIALDTAPTPASSVDALFATNNFKAGLEIGKYAKAAFKASGETPHIVMMDLEPGPSVGYLRHNGFMSGFGLKGIPSSLSGPASTKYYNSSQVECSADSYGDQTKGQTAMENCLQKAPDVNLVYTINEPAAAGAYTALKKAGKAGQAMIVSVDGGCSPGLTDVKAGIIAATSQQYPLKMASRGVDAVVKYAQTGEKPVGYTDTGVNLIAGKAIAGVSSKSVAFGVAGCWG